MSTATELPRGIADFEGPYLLIFPIDDETRRALPTPTNCRRPVSGVRGIPDEPFRHATQVIEAEQINAFLAGVIDQIDGVRDRGMRVAPGRLVWPVNQFAEISLLVNSSDYELEDGTLIPAFELNSVWVHPKIPKADQPPAGLLDSHDLILQKVRDEDRIRHDVGLLNRFLRGRAETFLQADFNPAGIRLIEPSGCGTAFLIRRERYSLLAQDEIRSVQVADVRGAWDFQSGWIEGDDE